MSPRSRLSARANSPRYPWFLETFDGYPYPIQRADAIRYFVLHHFGGIYIDLDDVRIREIWSTPTPLTVSGMQPQP
jgi:mannosyltransferase OCH1-like enzyme